MGFRRSVAAVWTTAAIVSFSATTTLAQQQCTPVVNTELRAHGIDPATVSGIVYGREYSTGDGADLIGYQAWVGFTTCAGNLVMEMSLGCGVRNKFTRRECRIAGLHHSC